MTNPIFNAANTNAFTPLSNNGVNYAITTPFHDAQKQETEEHKEKKSHKLGYNIARLTLAVGLGVLVLTKGLPKGAKGKVSEFFKYLEAKTLNLTKNSKHLTGVQRFYYEILKTVKPLFDYTKILFTAASLKDVIFKRVFKKAPSLENIGNKITNIFEGVSKNTSRNAYGRTLDRSERMFADFAEATSKITDKSQAEGLRNRYGELREIYTRSFSEEARNARLQSTKDNMDKGGELSERLWDRTLGEIWDFIRGKRQEISFIKDKTTYNTFIPEEMVAPAKKQLAAEVKALREQITIRFINKYNEARGLLGSITKSIDPTDESLRFALKSIRKELESAGKTGKLNETSRTSILRNIEILSKKLPGSEDIKDLIKVIKSSDDKGKIQEILAEYKKVLSKEDYARLEKSVNRTLNSLDHAIDLETDKLFDKVRDFKIGSAIHDSLSSILFPIGILGWGLSKADNNDERISVGLKYGVPAIGAVAVATYCTIGLYATGPSLIIGLVSGFAMNKVCEVIDKMRKKYQEEPPTLALPNIDLSSPIKNIENIEKHS